MAQHYPAIEIIVFEGGSTDETPAVFERYADLPDIHVIEAVPPRGQSAALNVGFRAEGEVMGIIGRNGAAAVCLEPRS